MGRLPHRILAGLAQIVNGTPVIPSPREVYRQLDGNLSGVFAVSCFFAFPDLPV
jgi:hypothetical protein